MFLTKREKSWKHLGSTSIIMRSFQKWNLGEIDKIVWDFVIFLTRVNCDRFFLTWLCWPICRASVSDRFVTLLGPRKKSLKKHRKSADAAFTWQFWSYFLVTIIFMVLVLIMKAVMGLVMESVMGSVWEIVSTLDQFDIYVTLLLICGVSF